MGPPHRPHRPHRPRQSRPGAPAHRETQSGSPCCPAPIMEVEVCTAVGLATVPALCFITRSTVVGRITLAECPRAHQGRQRGTEPPRATLRAEVSGERRRAAQKLCTSRPARRIESLRMRKCMQLPAQRTAPAPDGTRCPPCEGNHFGQPLGRGFLRLIRRARVAEGMGVIGGPCESPWCERAGAMQ